MIEHTVEQRTLADRDGAGVPALRPASSTISPQTATSAGQPEPPTEALRLLG
jgi:hypothetical protein